MCTVRLGCSLNMSVCCLDLFMGRNITIAGLYFSQEPLIHGMLMVVWDRYPDRSGGYERRIDNSEDQRKKKSKEELGLRLSLFHVAKSRVHPVSCEYFKVDCSLTHWLFVIYLQTKYDSNYDTSFS